MKHSNRHEYGVLITTVILLNIIMMSCAVVGYYLITKVAQDPRLYIEGVPPLKEKYIGSSDASITIIAYVDMTDESFTSFSKEVYPQLDEEWIAKNKVRLYIYQYITKEDITYKTARFSTAGQLLCSNLELKEFHTMTRTDKLADGVDTIAECMRSETTKHTLSRQAFEIEALGIIGAIPKFYIGIVGEDNTIITGNAEYGDLNQTIRYYQMMLGE